MAAELQAPETAGALASKKRKSMQRKGKRSNKRIRAPAMAVAPKHKQPSLWMRKLFRKRVREYNSDEDEEEEAEERNVSDGESSDEDEDEEEKGFDSGIYDSGGSDGDDEEEDGEGAKNAIGTRFLEGSSAFRIAFMKIMKKNIPNDPLGPILSAHKKLVAKKLAEEEPEHKVKGESKKKKQLAAEKAHVKPVNFLDSKEKYLISVATKGVVKLFNAVSKLQNPQKGLNPSSFKHAKELAKQKKQAFLSELRKPATQAFGAVNKENDKQPGWAPLRDSYMLTSSKLKDWDKMPDPGAVVGQEEAFIESSSDDE